MSKLFLDAPKAAQRLGLSVRHFRRLMDEQREIKPMQIGRKFFWRVPDIEAFAVRRQSEPCAK